jgi:hypothetical protein
MPEIEWVPMPDRERVAILGLLPDPCQLADEDGDVENYGSPIERVYLFTSTYTSVLFEDACFFIRALISDQKEWVYFFEDLFDADVIRIAGLGQPNDETAIKMYLRIADHTCETLPEKITCESAFKADKSWLKRWSQVGYYRDFPDLLESDFASCEYLLAELG